MRDLNAEGRDRSPSEAGKTGRENGGKGLQALTNMVGVMFEADRKFHCGFDLWVNHGFR